MFPICETSESHRVDGEVPLVNCLDGNEDIMGRGIIVYFKVRDRTRAPPQIRITPYFFNVRGDGLVSDDNANANVVEPVNVIEKSVDGDRGTSPAHRWAVVDDVEHSQTRWRRV
jgi:hypothetical protein